MSFSSSSPFQVGENVYRNVWYIDIYHLVNIDLVGCSMQRVLSNLKYLACSHGYVTGHKWYNERIEYLNEIEYHKTSFTILFM